MYRHIVTLVLFMHSIFCIAQQTNPKDISSITLRELDSLRNVIEKRYNSLDSIRKYVYQLDSLEQIYYEANTFLNRGRNNYSAPFFVFQISQAKIADFNQELIQLGIPTLNNNFIGLGFGTAFRRNRFLHEIYLCGIVGQKVGNQDLDVIVGGGSLMNYQIGFDLINKKRFHLYPFVGIEYGSVYINVLRNNAISSPALLKEISQSVNRARIQKDEFRVNYGLELDYHLSYRKYNSTILTLKYGMGQPISSFSYRANQTKLSYEPHINIRSAFFMVMVKFAIRR